MRATSSLWPRCPGQICHPQGLPNVEATICAKAATFRPALVHFSTESEGGHQHYATAMICKLSICGKSVEVYRAVDTRRKGDTMLATLRTLACLVC